jgi:hypothetical protein
VAGRQPRSVSSDGFRAEVEKWIEARGEVWVDAYFHHSGGGPLDYLLRDRNDVTEFMSRTVVNAKTLGDGAATLSAFDFNCFPLRGAASEELAERMRTAWLGGRWYHIVDLAAGYPAELEFLGSGDTSEDLEADLVKLLSEHRGRYVGFGEHPLDHEDWFERGIDIIETTVGSPRTEN